MKTDIISRIICDSLSLRAYTVTSLAAVSKITSLHDTSPNATVALGRTLTAAALLSATLKPGSSQSILVKIEGSGPIREIHAQADARGNIRGYAANPRPDLSEDIDGINFSRTIGAGFLTVRKDIGMKEPYTSVLPLKAGDVALDIAYYLTASEQVPSAVIIAITIEKDGSLSSSGGILIQTLPDTPEESITRVENNISSMTYGLGESLKSGVDILDVLRDIFAGEHFEVLESHPLRASCRCGKQAITDMLVSIDLNELQDMHDRDHGAEVTCSFCSEKYRFSESDLAEIIRRKKAFRSGEESGTDTAGAH